MALVQAESMTAAKRNVQAGSQGPRPRRGLRYNEVKEINKEAWLLNFKSDRLLPGRKPV